MYHVDVSGSACDENSSLKMDDLALLDLLECPVCFEKLDATAKVLPCQHTFCKPCLQRILKSQKELRCPECRTLVLCSIEQLPSNLLLIRLLDGVRCGQNVTRFGSIQRSGVLSSPASIRRVPRGLQLNQYRLAPNPRIHMEGPNTTARQLLQTSKSHQSPQFKYASPLRTASPKSKDTDSPTFHKVSDSRRKSLRQFSITTALNTLNRMVHSPSDRQTLEISSPVLISSSNPTVATQSSEKVEFPYGTPLQVSASYYPAPGSLGHSAAIVTLPHLQHHVSANMCVALHSYMAHGPDELELQKGEGVRVFGKYHDGWLRGMSLVTGRVGIFPSNYVAPLFRKSNLPDSKMPSLYASWTLSTSSLSSQGSISENGQRQSRPLKSALLPMPMTSPGRNTAMLTTSGQTSLRRGRGSTRKNGSLQRPGQPGTPIHVAGSLRRLPATALRPQQFQLYQHISPQPHNIPSGAAMTDVGTRPNLSHDASPAPVVRGGESKTPSVCSSVILDAKDPPAKSETAPKPPASAPPSILVKPDTSRNSTEKQVKTVRFQNYSPPPSKRHSLQPSPSLPRGKMEQGAAADALLSEANLMGTELTVLYSPRISSSPVHQRRVSHPKASSLDLSGQAGQLTFPIKKNYSSISAN
ncbi:E3 ubiquitin-protein ligase SH3RF2 isoform X2 [Struthio camelus]|uniref:E3 ubiquitin-protein ligase SH3RF2 isoform X2 n=1 Tax=Struthio camelus TaxID=8801 RepID=UPI003603EB65